jgi:putative transcriptional regulator
MKSRLREFRGAHRMTQVNLAIQAGVTRQTIISLENETYKPSLVLAMKLAKILNCSVESLFELEEGD